VGLEEPKHFKTLHRSDGTRFMFILLSNDKPSIVFLFHFNTNCITCVSSDEPLEINHLMTVDVQALYTSSCYLLCPIGHDPVLRHLPRSSALLSLSLLSVMLLHCYIISMIAML